MQMFFAKQWDELKFRAMVRVWGKGSEEFLSKIIRNSGTLLHKVVSLICSSLFTFIASLYVGPCVEFGSAEKTLWT